MAQIAEAYWDFWKTAVPYNNGYLPAFPEGTVLANTTFPYLTYSMTRNDFFTNGLDQVRIWTRSTNIQQVTTFTDHISKKIPHGGVSMILPNEAGALMLYRGTPFIQMQPMDEPDLQVAYINIIVNNYMI